MSNNNKIDAMSGCNSCAMQNMELQSEIHIPFSDCQGDYICEQKENKSSSRRGNRNNSKSSDTVATTRATTKTSTTCTETEATVVL